MHPLAQVPKQHSDIKLRRLNTEHVDAYLRSDVDWYRRHLAEEFRCITASGDVMDRGAFLAAAAAPVEMTAFEVRDVSVEFDGDTAVVNASTAYEQADGACGQRRYTDVWIGRDGRWQVLSAQVIEIAAP